MAVSPSARRLFFLSCHVNHENQVMGLGMSPDETYLKAFHGWPTVVALML